MWKSTGKWTINRDSSSELGTNRNIMFDDYSSNMDCTNGKSNDIFTEYAMMMGSIETWK